LQNIFLSKTTKFTMPADACQGQLYGPWANNANPSNGPGNHAEESNSRQTKASAAALTT